jgi:hypothetical protein
MSADNLKFNVPSGNSGAWAIHIYNLIKHANKALVKNNDVCLAYNNFVECLHKNSPRFQTWIPHNQYKNGFRLHSNPESFYGIPGRYITHSYTNMNRDDLDECLNDIVNNYMPLYNLVKDDVIPYMETKYAHECRKKEIKDLKSSIYKFEKKIAKYQEYIYSYQAKLAAAAGRLEELQAKSGSEKTK